MNSGGVNLGPEAMDVEDREEMYQKDADEKAMISVREVGDAGGPPDAVRAIHHKPIVYEADRVYSDEKHVARKFQR